MLGLEEQAQLLVGDLDPTAAEQLLDEAWILDLLERAGHPEERLVVLPEVRGHRVELR